MGRVQFLIVILFTSTFAEWRNTSASISPRSVPSSCPVTLRSNIPAVPPPQFSKISHPNAFWLGQNQLWTLVTHADGIWGLPRQKVFWFYPTYDWKKESKPSLVITARRLDGESPAISFSVTNGYRKDWGSFMVSIIDIPKSGCWEIKGSYAHEALSFIVWVEQSP